MQLKTSGGSTTIIERIMIASWPQILKIQLSGCADWWSNNVGKMNRQLHESKVLISQFKVA